MKVLLIPSYWSDESGFGWSGDVAAMAARTRSWYLAASYGKVIMDITVAPQIRLSLASTSDARALNDDGQLAASGHPPLRYDKLVYLTSRNAAVGFKGLTWSQRECWVNCMGSDYARFSIIHELGHSFGLQHPCVLAIGAWDGATLTLPQLDVTRGGQLTAIYDVSTAMGYEASMADFSSPEKGAIGWLTPFVHAGGDRTYAMRPIEQHGDAIKIAMSAYRASSQRVYWIERREGLAAFAANGIQLRILGDFGCLTPGHVGPDSNASRFALQPGHGFTDRSITVRVNSDWSVRVGSRAS